MLPAPHKTLSRPALYGPPFAAEACNITMSRPNLTLAIRQRKRDPTYSHKVFASQSNNAFRKQEWLNGLTDINLSDASKLVSFSFGRLLGCNINTQNELWSF